MWKDHPKAIKNFQHKITCLFSKLGPDNPKRHPQLVHTDFTKAGVVETKKKVDEANNQLSVKGNQGTHEIGVWGLASDKIYKTAISHFIDDGPYAGNKIK